MPCLKFGICFMMRNNDRNCLSRSSSSLATTLMILVEPRPMIAYATPVSSCKRTSVNIARNFAPSATELIAPCFRLQGCPLVANTSERWQTNSRKCPAESHRQLFAYERASISADNLGEVHVLVNVSIIAVGDVNSRGLTSSTANNSLTRGSCRSVPESAFSRLFTLQFLVRNFRPLLRLSPILCSLARF